MPNKTSAQLQREIDEVLAGKAHATKRSPVIGSHDLGTADERTGDGAYWIVTVPTGYRVDYKPWGPSNEGALGTFSSRRQARSKITEHARSLGTKVHARATAKVRAHATVKTKFSNKQIGGYLQAAREPLGISFNDGYNKPTYGITRAEFGEIGRAMHETYGMFPENTLAGVRKALRGGGDRHATVKCPSPEHPLYPELRHIRQVAHDTSYTASQLAKDAEAAFRNGDCDKAAVMLAAAKRVIAKERRKRPHATVKTASTIGEPSAATKKKLVTEIRKQLAAGLASRPVAAAHRAIRTVGLDGVIGVQGDDDEIARGEDHFELWLVHGEPLSPYISLNLEGKKWRVNPGGGPNKNAGAYIR